MSWDNLPKSGKGPSTMTDEQWDAYLNEKIPGLGSTSTGLSSGSNHSWKGSNFARCYETHPPYPVADGLVLFGSSCFTPIVKDADVYVGFDSGMKPTEKSYPWSPQTEFLYHITDMSVPKDPASFKKLVEYLATQVSAGKKVHCGCIGGHGRTGMVLAALRKHMTGDEKAISHVRANYCKKAVESAAQVEFLVKHFGVEPAEPTKSYSSGGAGYAFGPKTKGKPKSQAKLKVYSGSDFKTEMVGALPNAAGSIWKPSA